jgi:DNA gyrase subunit A
MKVNTIRETGRATQGVKLITLNDKESIQEITLVIPDDEEDAEDSAVDSDAELDSATTEDAAPATDAPAEE